jgi:hypothetical protein
MVEIEMPSQPHEKWLPPPDAYACAEPEIVTISDKAAYFFYGVVTSSMIAIPLLLWARLI